MLKKQLRVLLGLLVFSLLLVACSEDGEENTAPDESDAPIEETDDTTEDTEREPLDVNVSDEETVDASTVVLVINGEEVNGETYNDTYFNTKRYMMQNNQDVSDIELIKEQTLTTLKSYTLLRQDAEERGIEVTDQDVTDALDETKAQFESDEEYETALTQLAYTEESFKQSLEEQLLQQMYMDQVIETEAVTEEEITEFYGLLEEQLDDTPPLEEVRDQIVTQIEQSKMQQAFLAQIEELNEQAEIEQNI
ncbi:SurA N-terminal domain-containing protein [Halolactibacillus sp. JCM 19043]|uniref:SurA N-terminal domain-containing protein n=1 Tax=Halolactibacillus sp. JCM 19043 TaxID=1460638 RepID=UPI000785085A|nr:SurA N-terminal domain-containing protein [Halolactibacillus sp. JCM 19043]